MTRSPGDAPRRLIKAGIKILEENGFSGLSVRAVAARAGVNLGLVSYHFGGKDAFVHRVASEIYDEFFRDFSLQVEVAADPLAALRTGLLRLARFIRDHRRLIAGLIRDIATGHDEARRFAQTNFPRHGIVLAGLLRRCQGEGLLAELPLGVAMSTMMSVTVFPPLVAETMKCLKIKKRAGAHPDPRRFVESLVTDEALEQRVDLILRALKP